LGDFLFVLFLVMFWWGGGVGRVLDCSELGFSEDGSEHSGTLLIG